MTAEPVVFIVDDDPAARDSVAAFLHSKGLTTRVFASAEEFLAGFDPTSTGCLLVDMRMPGLSGLDLMAQLIARKITLPLIIMTGFGDVPTAVRAMQAGAVTFLEKPARAAALWSAVQNALERSARQTALGGRLAELQSRLRELTPEERRIIRLMLAGKTNKAIAGELDIGMRTVELRRATIMKKMQADSFAELVRMVVEVDPDGDLHAC